MSRQVVSRSRRFRRRLDSVLLLIVLALGALGAIAVISGQYQLRPVLSESMRPTLPVGGVVVTERIQKSELAVGDVVVLHRPDRPDDLFVHRIIAITPGPSGPIFETQGDANAVADPWRVTLRGDTAYRAIYSVPLIGYVAVWSHGTARQILLGGGAALVVIGSLGAFAMSRSAKRRAMRPGEPSLKEPSTV